MKKLLSLWVLASVALQSVSLSSIYASDLDGLVGFSLQEWEEDSEIEIITPGVYNFENANNLLESLPQSSFYASFNNSVDLTSLVKWGYSNIGDVSSGNTEAMEFLKFFEDFDRVGLYVSLPQTISESDLEVFDQIFFEGGSEDHWDDLNNWRKDNVCLDLFYSGPLSVDFTFISEYEREVEREGFDLTYSQSKSDLRLTSKNCTPDEIKINTTKRLDENLVIGVNGLSSFAEQIFEYPRYHDLAVAFGEGALIGIDEILSQYNLPEGLSFTAENIWEYEKKTHVFKTLMETKKSLSFGSLANGEYTRGSIVEYDNEYIAKVNEGIKEGRALSWLVNLSSDVEYTYDIKRTGQKVYFYQEDKNIDMFYPLGLLQGTYYRFLSGTSPMAFLGIGIFANISVASFNAYFAKARDAKRQAIISQINNALLGTLVSSSNPDSFYYADMEVFEQTLKENFMEMPIAENGYDFYFVPYGGVDYMIAVCSEDNSGIVFLNGNYNNDMMSSNDYCIGKEFFSEEKSYVIELHKPESGYELDSVRLQRMKDTRRHPAY